MEVAPGVEAVGGRQGGGGSCVDLQSPQLRLIITRRKTCTELQRPVCLPLELEPPLRPPSPPSPSAFLSRFLSRRNRTRLRRHRSPPRDTTAPPTPPRGEGGGGGGDGALKSGEARRGGGLVRGSEEVRVRSKYAAVEGPSTRLVQTRQGQWVALLQYMLAIALLQQRVARVPAHQNKCAC